MKDVNMFFDLNNGCLLNIFQIVEIDTKDDTVRTTVSLWKLDKELIAKLLEIIKDLKIKQI